MDIEEDGTASLPGRSGKDFCDVLTAAEIKVEVEVMLRAQKKRRVLDCVSAGCDATLGMCAGRSLFL